MIDLLKQAMDIKTDSLFLVVLGASGSGKSHFIGTYPGRVLYLYGAGESHGAGAAMKSNKDVVPYAWDREKQADGSIKELGPDTVLKKLIEVLDPKVLKANKVKCVALDSITNLALTIRNSSVFKQKCQSAQGKHNQFKESEVLIELLTMVISKLQHLVDHHDIDVIAPIDLQITSVGEDGTILESKPGLPTYGVGKAVIQQFPDILVLRRESATRSIFQQAGKVASQSKDANQNVVKYIEYHPRLSGVVELPEVIEANVQEILKLKGR